MKTLVLGLGNPILTDDGVGVQAAGTVRQALPVDTPIEVREASGGGLALMEAVLGYDRVILIDACQRYDGQPGAIHRLTLDDLRVISPTQHTVSSHETSLVTALEMGRQMGLPLPQELVIYAVDVENVTDFGEELTPAVGRALPELTTAVLNELAAGGVSVPLSTAYAHEDGQNVDDGSAV